MKVVKVPPTYQVDYEAQDGDDQKPFVLDFRRLDGPLDGFGKDEEGDEQEKEPIHKT